MTDPFELDDQLLDNQRAASESPELTIKHGDSTAAADTTYLDALNGAQRQAVETIEGPLLVLAGAGTGKTRVLVTRISHILNLGLARPWEILAVTFTNKAAKEMSQRVAQLVGGAVDGMWLGTFHSIGARILRNHAEIAGLKNNFTIIDTDDQIRVLKKLMKERNIDEKRWSVRALAAIINRWKDRGLSPEKTSNEDPGEFAAGRTIELFHLYCQTLKVQNAADFGDLLLHCLTIFQQQPDVLKEHQQRFKYILVDEYQDTNVSQYLWLRLLAQGKKNICCVGDDDQSIYGWRGAEVGNILRFEKDFEGAKVIRLERNYRSQPHILAAASKLIENNESRLGKTLWTDANEGDRVKVRCFWNSEEEAYAVAEDCEYLASQGLQLSQIAILVRASFQTREFEDRFLTLGLPYRVIGGPRFYERREIRDAIAYLRVISQPDDGIAFERIVNVPKRGLGDATIQSLHKLSRHSGQSLLAAARNLISTDELRPQARKTLSELLETINRWRAKAETDGLGELLQTVLEESNYNEMLRRDQSIEAPGRRENLQELVNTVVEYESLTEFLDHVSLVMDHDSRPGDNMISIMTLHAAKGLEFDAVFLPGWEEGLMPNQRSLDENGLEALEEERRLAHVGITRARKIVRISFANSRRMFSEWQNNLPSRFIEELPAQSVELQGQNPALIQPVFGPDEFNQDPKWNYSERSRIQTSPGRRRMLANKKHVNRGGNVVRNRPKATEDVHDPGIKFDVGDRVFHKKFGYGQIISIDGNRLKISFKKAGDKKVIDSFVERA